jgi:hypothetical protein
LLVGHALAETECDYALKTDLQRTDVISSDRTQATHNFACSHSFQEFNDTYDGSAAFHYGAIGGSGAYNQGNYKKFQDDHCKEASAYEHANGFQYYALRDANPDALREWGKCIANLGGFYCWTEPESQDIAIVLSLKEGGNFTIDDTTLSQGATIRSSADRIASGKPIQFGVQRVVIQRSSSQTPVSLTMNISRPGQIYSCRAVVPASVDYKETRLFVERDWGQRSASETSRGSASLVSDRSGHCFLRSNEPLSQEKWPNGEWRYIFHSSEFDICQPDMALRFRTYWYSAGPVYWVQHDWKRVQNRYEGTFSDSNGFSGFVRAAIQ